VTRRVRTPVDPAYLRDLFSHSARFYDPVNVITSWGQVGRWRDETIAFAAPGPADRVLDAFCGPGGLAERALAKLGSGSELVLADLSPVMLHAARRRLSPRSGHPRQQAPRIAYVTGDILRDDLGLGTFDVVLLGWGLRYVPDIPAAVARLGDFLRPGGRLTILEFTKPTARGWALPAQLYFRRVLPSLGSWLARDRELYDYLRASSETFLDTPALIKVVSATGLRVVGWRTHLGGLVTILVATREGG
jgi:demethylmenaquinone methyltransferase / 2-methoxy-6-polyprenyl-1,4-benzoquinol methylase